MYGETPNAMLSDRSVSGLSPHVRGNRRWYGGGMTHRWSIPACTGKPRTASGICIPTRVYPRMYGETADEDGSAPYRPGLSPHVRGNHFVSGTTYDILWSIPACTGKPGRTGGPRRRPWVYPRMYGETLNFESPSGVLQGLSPHVRGNHLYEPLERAVIGSIPACTGKPESCRRTVRSPRVYPRMYGETEPMTWRENPVTGLSPHVRGNLCVKMTHS